MSYGVIVTEYGYPRYKGVPANTFADFLDYVKANKDVSRVVIPHTSYGYGSSFVEDANREWMEDHYPRAVKLMEFNATVSRWKFLQSEELQAIVEGLEDYPLISDDYHSRIESAAHLEHFKDEMRTLDGAAGLELEHIEDVLAYHGYAYWELVQTDNDGATSYMQQSDLEMIATFISQLSANNE